MRASFHRFESRRSDVLRKEMSRFRPFGGLRYDTNVVALDHAIAPPYDVVNEPERAKLAARSPYNAIHVELPIANESSGLDRYANAASIFSSWQDSGALR